MPVAVVLVAMDDEAAPFLDLASEVGEPERVGRAELRHITLAGQPVVLVRSGIGFVNTTAAGTSTILRHGVDVPLISAGSAGGLGKDVAVGDVVLGSRLVNADADARAFGYVLGQVPGMPEAYDAAPRLAGAVRQGAATVAGQVLREGTIGSGEKFATADLALRLRADFPDMLAIDMESAALAQLCHNFGAEFVSVRAVSDLCAPDGTEFLTHVDDAALRSAQVVTATVGLLAG
ncbi:5'-methylthioadenosine/S-adenosylhomocysteine nucleosidase [Promicromonospora sp. NPDC050249]|uniref:5'-methylthioadenosine/S-adenosylhomocysteine nucleosidase n=1 Tax=Promicromonospora sp. NPDC050249 TaxID=3154743 RepID=UPI0033C832B2